MRKAGRILSPLLLLFLGGCFQPTPPRLAPPRARPALGRWKREAPGRWRHLGEGEGVLLLPLRGDLRLELRIRPGPGCASAGVLAGYHGPGDTHAVLARRGAPPHLVYIRWENSKRISPPTASFPLERGDWKGGFPLTVEIRRRGVRAFRGPARPGLTWRPPLSLAGRIGLYAKGPALFVLEGEEPLEGIIPPPDPSRIWSRFPPYAPGPCRRAAAALVERSLAALRKHKVLPPREAAPAWLWTGDEVFRQTLDSWAADPPPTGRTPREIALRILDLLALRKCLPSARAEKIRARAQSLAAGLARIRKKTGLWEGAGRDPSGAWILPGRAILAFLPLVRGPEGNALFQAWRAAMNHLVEALLPGKKGESPARTWATRDLLEAGIFLAESSSRRAALSSSIEALECLLEERRLEEKGGTGLLLLERDGREAPPELGLLWARLLCRQGGETYRAGYAEAALRAASAALLKARGKTLPFSALAALLRDVPRLAPPGALAILDTSTGVVSILKEDKVLSWTTNGPSAETLLSGFSRLVFREGKKESLLMQGPLLEIVHESPRGILRAAPPGPHR